VVQNTWSGGRGVSVGELLWVGRACFRRGFWFLLGVGSLVVVVVGLGSLDGFVVGLVLAVRVRMGGGVACEELAVGRTGGGGVCWKRLRMSL
jgi:hypothetical protein